MQLVKRIFTIGLVLIVGFIFVQFTGEALEAYAQIEMQQPAPSSADTNQRLAPPEIDSTNLITIPYGFDSPLPILADGTQVLARGHGACTDGEQVTVAITLTQATSGAIATGEDELNCTGELQNWEFRTTAVTPDTFAEDTAEACGLATTRADGSVTDTFEWCVDVDLVALDQQLYLPTTIKTE